MDFIPYTKQSLNIDDIHGVLKSFGSDLITRGPLVKEFEKKCAALCQVEYAVMFNSGTSALSACSYAIDVTPEDTVVTSPNTFVGTIAGALQRTRHLQFLDIDLKTGSPNFEGLEKPKDGRLILFPVHFAGIAKLILKPFKECAIIEDACEAFGSQYSNGQPVGSCPHSDLTVFSFHPAKTICTGEGGLVTTQSKAYYEKLLLYRNNGIIKKEDSISWIYEVHDLTTNSNVTDFAAALGLSQLKRLDSFLEKRRTLIKRYRDNLHGFQAISLLDESYDSCSAHNLFPIQIDFEKAELSRESLILQLKERGIGTQVHFIPLYHHPYFKKNYPLNPDSFPKMQQFYKKALSLPIFSHLSIKQVDQVCEQLLNLLKPSKSFA